MRTGYYILICIVILHLLNSIKAIRLVNKSIVLSAKQKRLNRIFILLIPFLWVVFLKGALHETPGYHKAPDEIKVSETDPGNPFQSGGDM